MGENLKKNLNKDCVFDKIFIFLLDINSLKNSASSFHYK